MKTKTRLTLGILVLLCCSLFITATPIRPISVSSPRISARGDGDVNSDGRIDIIDAYMVLHYYVGYIGTLPNVSAADVNDDAVINTIDALNIANNYVNASYSLQDWIPYTSTAGGPDKVWFENITPSYVGEIFTTNICVNTGAQKLGAYGFEVEYDPTILKVLSVQEGSEGFLTVFRNQYTDGWARMCGFDVDGEGPDSRMELLEVTWEAIGIGSTTVNNTIDRLVDNIYNPIGTPYTDDWEVSILRNIGDVNSDQTIDQSDVLAIGEFSIGSTPPTFYEDVADVNFDGEINGIDCLQLQQFILGYTTDVNHTLPSNGGGTARVWVDSLDDAVPGTQRDTSLFLECSQAWAAYQLDLYYDYTLVEINSITDGAQGDLAVSSFDNMIGAANVVGVNATGIGPGTDQELFSINWDMYIKRQIYTVFADF